MLKVLLLDNYDSFTYMLKDYIEQCGASCEVIRNDESELIERALKSDAIVISPGPKTPHEAGNLMHCLDCIIRLKPVLGVCLGHQAIGEYFGATLSKARLPKHGKVETLEHDGDPIFNTVPHRFEATRYHSLVIHHLPETLQTTAVSTEGEVMGIKHKQLPVWGIQFHPESCTTNEGLSMIKNFLHLAELSL